MKLIIITQGQVIIYKRSNIKRRALLYLFLIFLVNSRGSRYSNIKSITWSLRLRI